MEEQIIVVPGDPSARGLVAIWSDTRPHPAHCWDRASLHCIMDYHWGYNERREASRLCRQMVAAILIEPRPPRRAIQWGWGKGWPGLR